MHPYKEDVPITGSSFPVRVLVNSTHGRRIQVHPHWHEEIEILYYMEGHARQQVSDHVFEGQKGDIVIIGSNEIHSTYTTLSDFTAILVVQFSSSLLDPNPGIYPGRQSSGSTPVHIDYPVPIPEDGKGKEIIQCLTDIEQEFFAKKPAYEYYIKSHILRLAGILTRRYGCRENLPVPNPGSARYREILKEVFRYIDRHYTEELTLASAAKAANLSTAHFCRLFKKSTGTTFKDYLLLYRVNKAEELLYTPLPITEISYSCGFNSVASFNRAFRRYKKTTPSAYRSRL